MGTVDLESGERRSITTGGSDDDDDDVGSCISQLFSVQDGTEDDGSSRAGKLCPVVDCSILIDHDHDSTLQDDDDDDETKRECRICHLTMEFGMAIELGCSCKDDLGAAHKHCAETWFNIKGNRHCEICNSVALNVIVPMENNELGITLSINVDGTSASPDLNISSGSDQRIRSCSNGHRVVNFILSCMIFAFSISWLFHLNVDP